MRWLPSIPRLLFAGILLAGPASAVGAENIALRGLILTSPGIYHNYAYQNPLLADAITDRLNIQFDVSLTEIQRWKAPNFAADYDVIIYNICMADSQDIELISNLRRQTEVFGTPAIVLHCAMHSFRDTPVWWPFHGLKTQAHEPLGEMRVDRTEAHPVLAGVPDPWLITSDELYINMDFTAAPLLRARGDDDAEHVVAWLTLAGKTPVFGTTLGHSDSTLEDPHYQRLVSNAVLWVTGNLNADGTVPDALAPTKEQPAIAATHTGPDVQYLGEEGQDCAFSQLARAVGPCYVGCTLNPFVWGSAAHDCRRRCEDNIPGNEAILDACMPRP